MSPTGIPTSIEGYLLSQGPAGVIILVLIIVVVVLFKKWDADRERLIDYGGEYAKLATSTAKAVEVSNANAGEFIGAMQTFKLLSELDRRKAI